MPSSGQVAASSFCGLLVFISCILLGVSFDTLEPRFHAIVYDETYMTVPQNDVRRSTAYALYAVEGTPMENGRYMLGLGRSLIRYPASFVNFEFVSEQTGAAPLDGGSLSVWSSNGQNVLLDVSLQISLAQDKLTDMYYTFDTHWRDYFRVMITHEVKMISTEFSTLSFFTDRTAISERLRTAIATRVRVDGYASLVFFQLRRVDMPDKFEQAVLDKLLKLQEQRKMTYDREVRVLDRRRQFVLAMAERDATLVLAQARAQGDAKIGMKEASALRRQIVSYAEQYKSLSNELGWSADKDLGARALHYYVYTRAAKMGEVPTTEMMGL